MDDHSNANVLGRTMADLTQGFFTATEIDAALNGVTAASVRLIAGVDFADILIISGPDQSRSLAPTAQIATEIDDLQRRFGEGPGVDAAGGDSVIRCNDLCGDTRWPRFAKSAVAAGVRSMLSFQLYTHHARSAALNLLGTEPGVFDSDVETLGAMLATHAATALIANDKELQFKSALASRDLIGQAKGMIMELFEIDAVRAFELLVKLSQQTNTRLVQVAAEIVARGSGPVPASHQRSLPPSKS